MKLTFNSSAALLSVLLWCAGLSYAYFQYENNSFREFLVEIDRLGPIHQEELRAVLSSYAELIEAADPESAKIFYQNRGGDRARHSLIEDLSIHLFVYRDKYGNFHSFKPEDLYSLSQRSGARYADRLFFWQCRWFENSASSRYFLQRSLCEKQPTKMQKGEALYELVDSAYLRIEERYAKADEAGKKTARFIAAAQIAGTTAIASILLLLLLYLNKIYFRKK